MLKFANCLITMVCAINIQRDINYLSDEQIAEEDQDGLKNVSKVES